MYVYTGGWWMLRRTSEKYRTARSIAHVATIRVDEVSKRLRCCEG
eukprot:COSAG02_NODE_38898_length_423_cov_1.123457_1_plen_44_part_10